MRTCTEAEQQVLLTLGKIYWHDKVASRKRIDLFNSFYWGEDLLDWTTAWENLLHDGLIKARDDTFFLTKAGHAVAEKVDTITQSNQRWILMNESQTYRFFCERVNQFSFPQNNWTDSEQLATLINAVNLNKPQQVLDLGCGIGTLTEYIHDQIGAAITGLDFSPKAIEIAQKRISSLQKLLTFQEGDLDELDFPSETFDTIIDIDSIIFGKDLDAIIDKLLEILKPEGQLILFYNQMARSGGAQDALEPEKSRLAVIMEKNSLDYRFWSFTEQMISLLGRMQDVLEELREDFIKEDAYSLYFSLIIKYDHFQKFFLNNQASRYLYQISKKSRSSL